MRALDDEHEPYRVQLSLGALRQLEPLEPQMRDRVRSRLGQLAELSALSRGYVQSLPRAVLRAEEEGLSIRYEVDDDHCTLTAFEILGPQTGTRRG